MCKFLVAAHHYDDVKIDFCRACVVQPILEFLIIHFLFGVTNVKVLTIRKKKSSSFISIAFTSGIKTINYANNTTICIPAILSTSVEYIEF